MPCGALWDYFGWKKGVPAGLAFMDEIRDYEKRMLSERS
jgi:L-rhamnose isomerase